MAENEEQQKFNTVDRGEVTVSNTIRKRLRSEDEILDPKVREEILTEIMSNEERRRRKHFWTRTLIYKDKTKRFVEQRLLDLFNSTTVERMRYAFSNISLFRKVIDKLARVYSFGVVRTISEDEESTEKLQKLEKLLDFNTEMKNTNRLLKANRNISVYLKPLPITDGESAGKHTLKVVPLNAYLYSVVENFWDRTKPMVYILSNFKDDDLRKTSIEPAKEGRTIATPQPSRKGDEIDQKIADVKEDEDAQREPFIWWTNSWHFTTNNKGEIVDPGTMMPLNLEGEELKEAVKNPIEEIPFHNFAINQDDSFWAEGGDDLVDGSILVNTMITNVIHIGVKQGYGQLILTGKRVPRNIEVSPDAAIALEYDKDQDPTPTATFITPNAPLAELRSTIEMYVSLMLTTNSLSTSGISMTLQGGSNFPSGISLMIDKSESVEDVQDQRQIFIDGEPEIWRKINKWLMAYSADGSLDPDLEGLVMPEGFENDLTLSFGDPITVISESEKLDNLKKRKELGIDDQLGLMMKDDPSMSRDQAEEKLQKILEEKIKRQSQFLMNGMNNKKEDGDKPVENDETTNNDEKEDTQEGATGDNKPEPLHTHSFEGGQTEPAGGPGRHSHDLPDGGKTSNDLGGPGHIHTLPDGSKTGGPIAVEKNG